MIYALSQTSGFMIVGLVTAACTFVSASLALRAGRQSKEVDASQGYIKEALAGQRDLITDLRTARDELKAEVGDLKTGQADDRSALASMADRLVVCETARAELAARLAVLEP